MIESQLDICESRNEGLAFVYQKVPGFVLWIISMVGAGLLVIWVNADFAIRKWLESSGLSLDALLTFLSLLAMALILLAYWYARSAFQETLSFNSVTRIVTRRGKTIARFGEIEKIVIACWGRAEEYGLDRYRVELVLRGGKRICLFRVLRGDVLPQAIASRIAKVVGIPVEVTGQFWRWR
jgi:hypothetical protein